MIDCKGEKKRYRGQCPPHRVAVCRRFLSETMSVVFLLLVSVSVSHTQSCVRGDMATLTVLSSSSRKEV